MTPPNTKVLNQLRLVSWLAALDAILLVTLVSAAVLHAQVWVQVLGPIHGINFLCLMAAVILPAVDGAWGWWFPLLVVFTGGPIGAFIGEWQISRAHRATPPNECDSRANERDTVTTLEG